MVMIITLGDDGGMEDCEHQELDHGICLDCGADLTEDLFTRWGDQYDE